MKPLTLFAICISLATHCAAAHGPTKRLDIVDCLELMPEAVFADWWHPFAKIEVLKSEIRRAATQPAMHFTLDVPNGYLHYPADDGGERRGMTITLFRQPDGGALIAMQCREGWEVLEQDILPAHPDLRNATGNPDDPVGPPWVEEAFRDFTGLGGVGVLGLLTAATLGYLLLMDQRRMALYLAGAIVGGLLLSVALKTGFHRPRPDLVSHGSLVYTSSFPSGHSMLSAIVYLTGGAMLAMLHRRRAVQVYILACACLATLLVGTSRVYLGVHWPTDVLAGWAGGGAWAALCWLVARRLQIRNGFHWRVKRRGTGQDLRPTKGSS